MIEKMQSAPDEVIASAIARKPSEELCRELYQRYSKKIYLWSFNYTHDVDEAAELSQEILIKIFQNIGSFAGLSRFSTWAYRVAQNHCMTELSRKKVQWRRRLQSLENGKDPGPVDTEFFSKVDTIEDLGRILEAAREYMDNDELEAFVLHYREGLTVKEITNILGCENATGARTLIQNARRKFSRLLEEKGFGNA